VAIAAPPSPTTERFDAAYRKTLEEYDREGLASDNAREAFQRGITALDDWMFDKARGEFAASRSAAASYAATFDEALSQQLARQYGGAESLHGEARRSHAVDPELETNLAIVLGREGKSDASMKAFDAALAAAQATVSWAGSAIRALRRRNHGSRRMLDWKNTMRGPGSARFDALPTVYDALETDVAGHADGRHGPPGISSAAIEPNGAGHVR